MKKLLTTLAALFTIALSASAMSYEQARERALFLTDKMAYELNLTDDQYEAAYEINLDYLMGVNDYNDLYGTYWRQRNLDLSYILLDWQYRTYCAASYFYRPLYWQAGCWHFGIYARYPHRTYFYFGRPHFYTVYRGGHSWRTNGGRSWYHGRTYGGPHPDGHKRVGMRDGFDRGDYGRGFHGDQPARFGNGTRQHGQPGHSNNKNKNNNGNKGNNGNNGRPQSGNRTFGNGNRESSTRTTVTRPSSNLSGSSFNGSRSVTSSVRNTTTPKLEKSTSTQRSFSGGNSSSGTRSFGGSKSSTGSRSFGGSSSSSTRSFGGGSSSSSRSFGGSSSSSTRSFGGGSSSSSRSSGGNSSNGGGAHFGGRR